MLFIDTHTHLFSESFNDDRDEIVEKAINAGVKLMLLPNIDVDSIQSMYALHDKYPLHCLPMIGLHPGSVGENWKKDLQIIESHLDKSENIAIGEIGMDLYWDKTFINEQKEAFRIQVNWAKKKKLPIAIHAREAFDEIFEILDEENDESLTGVFHCFTGTVYHAQKIKEYGGFKLGIGGVVTYKKAGLDEVLTLLSLSDLILETDSPYLPPVPYRGKRNESSYLIHIAEKIADIYNCPLNEVAKTTSKNAADLFNLNIQSMS
jgi:TatD DNase family protein